MEPDTKGESMDEYSFYGDFFIEGNWDDDAAPDKVWMLCGSSNGTPCARQVDAGLFAEYDIDPENLYRDRSHVYTIINYGNGRYGYALVDLCDSTMLANI